MKFLEARKLDVPEKKTVQYFSQRHIERVKDYPCVPGKCYYIEGMKKKLQLVTRRLKITVKLTKQRNRNMKEHFEDIKTVI